MNILFLNHNLVWRGTFYRCFGYARELVKLGHSVALWTVSNEPNLLGKEYSLDGVNVWLTPRWGYLGDHDGGYAVVDNLSRLIRSNSDQWDLVHAFDHRPNVLLPWLWMHCKHRKMHSHPSPLFLSDWCDWWAGGGITTSRRSWQIVDQFEQWIEEQSKLISDGVTVISSVLYERALHIGIPSDRLLCLPSGISIDSFPVYKKKESRNRLGLPGDDLIFGFIGFSLWDLEYLADAFSLIKKKIPNAKLLIIGGGVEERAKDILRHRFILHQDVFLPGVIPFPEVPRYLSACDIQLLPMQDTVANRARIPNKLFDYYASARPTIASNIGDTGKFVHEQQTGKVASNGVDEFAELCVEMAKSPDSWVKYGKQARKMAESSFDYSNLAQSLLVFYQKHLNTNR